MANAPDFAIVLKDRAGTCFVVPQEVLEQGRVPEERKAEVERLLAESDTSGFLIGIGLVVCGPISTAVARAVLSEVGTAGGTGSASTPAPARGA